jgi:heptosyltransferase-2
VGDVVMATPTLRAIRQVHPDAHITYLLRRNLRAIIDACPWHDRLITWRSGKKRGRFIPLAGRLRAGRFDLAVLLPNSFRSALLMMAAGIRRRIGYDRDGRGWLLTDRLKPRRDGRCFIPCPTLQYYLDIARRLGAQAPDPTMSLFTRPEDDAEAAKLLKQAGVDDRRPRVILNPGARYGDAKMWYPQRFAAVADMLIEQRNVQILISGAPNERPILDEVHAAAHYPLIDLPHAGIDLKRLKSVIRTASLMITNDTGPRHVAAAFGIPLVTIFGPTDPRWSEIDFRFERLVRVDVFCGPCQKKQCPLDHRCMTWIEPDRVKDEALALLDQFDEDRAPKPAG